MDFGFATVGAITVICYLCGMVVKSVNLDTKWIPIMCGCVGCILGVISMFIVPDFPGTDLVTSAAIGIVSGLAATGANQALRQMANQESISHG